ncbi:glycoside hydrolase family 16 protein [Bacillus alkalisoli]|uniref:glycoside hydrolase family 16 protein n=1 Tax=Bacillus alkalisoli TaxID=2011008 RepID=UPI000C23C8A3|nr:glycoside hydrolase family 16 protein [Bacillus alkalisoli]
MSRFFLFLIVASLIWIATMTFHSDTNSSNHAAIRVLEKNKEWNGMKYVNVMDDFSKGLNPYIWEVLVREENFNNELQYYSDHNVSVQEGVLQLTGKKESKGGKDFTSGLIHTSNEYPILYGHIKMRAKYPVGKGLFPAIWLAPISNDDYIPEVDIMEVIGSQPNKIYFVHHYRNASGNIQTVYESREIMNNDVFHTYELIWTKDKLEWLVNGVTTFRTEENIPNIPMKLIINLAIGGDWPGSPTSSTKFPAVFHIDSVEILHEKWVNN